MTKNPRVKNVIAFVADDDMKSKPNKNEMHGARKKQFDRKFWKKRGR